MQLLIYSKPDCRYCVLAENLLVARNVPYRKIMIGVDITADEFMGRFPGVRSVPYIIELTDADPSNTEIQIERKVIGGYTQLEEWIKK